jgi:hypothetical protein
MNTLLSKLKEPSTWAGLAVLTAAIGWKIDPDQFAAIGALIVALIGLWEVLRKEK